MAVKAPKNDSWNAVAEFHRDAYELAKARTVPQRVPLYDDAPIDSPGDVFVRSAAYSNWTNRFPSGGPNGPGAFNSDPAEVAGGFRTLLTTTDTSAGALVRPNRLGLLDSGLYRPVSVLQLLSRVPVTADAVEYAKEASHTPAASPVPEASALTGTSGTKPEGAVSFTLITERVRTFAVWVPATRNVLSDATELRQHIDGYLVADLLRVVEDEVITGDGTGEHFEGILNTPGVQTQAAPSAGETNFDVLRKAKTKVEVNGRTTPTAVVLNPFDGEQMDLAKVNEEVNRFVGDPYSAALRPLWGMTRLITDAVPQGTALVGDFSRAVLFDREQVNILVGTAGDDFVRNLVRILCEGRAAFGVIRPQAFVVTSLAS